MLKFKPLSLNLFFILAIGLFFISFKTNAQSGVNSKYTFEGTANDDSLKYNLLTVGTETYTTGTEGQAYKLIGESYLDAPLDLGNAILMDETFYISIDFNMPNEGIDESARILFGNKDWTYDTPGFTFQLLNEKTEWQQEGMAFVNFNIGGGGTEISGRFFNVPMGEWHRAYFIVDFKTETVTFGLNERTHTQSLRENANGNEFDPEPFYQSLSTKSIRIGGPQTKGSKPIDWQQFGNTATDHIAELRVDNLQIASPRPTGTPEDINSILTQFTNHINGTETLDDNKLESIYSELQTYLYGVNFSDIEAKVRTFIETHNTKLAPLYNHFSNEFGHKHGDFKAYSRAYIALSLWMLREGLTTANASLAEGITFQEHKIFPGSVPESAERVTGGTAAVKTIYVKDPYYNMGQMQTNESNELAAYVYRPTGFWAPAGEAVKITVPSKLVNTGVHIRVGGHTYDHTIFDATNRMPLLKADYRVEAESFDVINPMGGGIYVLVPLGLDFGWSDIQIDGAVRSPYFSMREGHLTTIEEWNTIQDYPGPLADFESDKYMFTVPSSHIRDFNNPDELLKKWDDAMDVYQLIHGRSMERARSEAFMYDTRTSVEGSYPGGYPVTPGSWAAKDGDIKKGEFSPFILINGAWKNDKRAEAMALFHEMAHHHLGYALEDARIPDKQDQWSDEIETFVNVPFAAIINSVLGEDMDIAMRHSTYQKFSRLDAAIDWMVTTNFRNGNPIGWDQTTDYQPKELPYQARGSAKYLDLADIFGGWDALGKIYKTFYDEDVAKGVPVTYATQPLVSRDRFLENGSNALGYNLESLFYFWGIHASDQLSETLRKLPPCNGADERIKYYLRNAPRTNEDLRAYHTEKNLIESNQLKFQIYDLLLPTFDTTEGQQIRTRGAEILSTYFDIKADDSPSVPVLLNSTFDLTGNPSDVITFSWTPSVDPEGEKLFYSWRLFNYDTKETLLSKSWVDGTSVEFTKTELITAISQNDGNSGQITNLGQEVITSDLFTIVKSEPLISSYVDGIWTDIEDENKPVDFSLNQNYPNPFNPATKIEYSIAEPAKVSIKVFDILGREIATLVDKEQSAGRYNITFNAENLSSGIYIYRITAGDYTSAKKMVLFK